MLTQNNKACFKQRFKYWSDAINSLPKSDYNRLTVLDKAYNILYLCFAHNSDGTSCKAGIPAASEADR